MSCVPARTLRDSVSVWTFDKVQGRRGSGPGTPSDLFFSQGVDAGGRGQGGPF